MYKIVISFLLITSIFSVRAQETDSLSLMVGQMIMVGMKNFYQKTEREAILDVIKQGKLGGVILFEKDLMPVNTQLELSKLVGQLQANAPIPMFMAIDEEGGKVNRFKPKYGFPRTVTAAYLGKLDNIDTTRHYATITASTLYRHGFNLNFAPVVDLNLNPTNPVIGKVERSYSADPTIVSKHAGIVVETHLAYGIATTLKHFPGHGSSATDTHLGLTDVTSSWRMEELFPYSTLLRSQEIPAVMTAHIINRTLDDKMIPATLSPKVVNGLLRDHLGFQGVVFSDDMHMGAIAKNYGFEDAVVRSILAGVDVLIFSNNIYDDDNTTTEMVHRLIMQKVKEGVISEARIKASYDRIIKLKSQIGLMDSNYTSQLLKRLK